MTDAELLSEIDRRRRAFSLSVGDDLAARGACDYCGGPLSYGEDEAGWIFTCDDCGFSFGFRRRQ